jgi:aryl-alcohol dehydrogenase-like predicted oxidoreductase
MTGVTRIHTVEEAQGIVDTMDSRGYSVIDCARRYGNGSAEEVSEAYCKGTIRN